MSGFDLQVDHGALDLAGSDVLGTARRIEARFATLESELGGLRGGWTGQARLAYDEAKAVWDRALTEMVSLLTEAGTAVHRANDEYRAADLRGARRF